MNPVPKDLIAFSRVPKRDRIGDWPQYRILIRTPTGVRGYTDIIVIKFANGWCLVDPVWHRSVKKDPDGGWSSDRYHPTRDAAAAEIHMAEAYIPENVREYLASIDDNPCPVGDPDCEDGLVGGGGVIHVQLPAQMHLGEAVNREEATLDVCPACDGDGRIPDKSGGGHHGRCKACGGSGKVTP